MLTKTKKQTANLKRVNTARQPKRRMLKPPPSLQGFDFTSMLQYLATDFKGQIFNATDKCECCGLDKPSGIFVTTDRIPFHLCAICRGALRAMRRKRIASAS